MMKLLRFAALLLSGCLVVLYAASCTYLMTSQESLLFFPAPVTPEHRELYAAYEVSFEVNSQQLSGWYFPGESSLTLFYYGGNGSELSDRIEDMKRLGNYGLLMINYRGYGDSSGDPDEAGMKADALAIFDNAVTRFNMDPQNIVLMGRSLGSGIAAHIAARRDTAGLILITPYDSILNIAKERYPVFPVSLLLRHPFNTLEDVDAIDETTLILKAETDNVVPHERTDNLIDHWRSNYALVDLPGSHSNVVDSAEYEAAVQNFLQSIEEFGNTQEQRLR